MQDNDRTETEESSEAAEKQKELTREVNYTHSERFVGILQKLGCSLLVSTYQAGRLASIGVADGDLSMQLYSFENVMGVAYSPKKIAVGTRGVIWSLFDESDRAQHIPPVGKYDKCFLTRTAHVTGHIHVHEMVWVNSQLLVVNTLFSCLCTLDENFSFVPNWKPKFITELKGEDRCHLNGIAIEQGLARFVTMMAETNTGGGWRENKNTTGIVMEISSGAVVTRGLAMPHSPRVYQDKLWVLNSGYGSLDVVDLKTGVRQQVTSLPGYTRGLSFCEDYAFIGLSKIRETAVFGGVPLAEYRDKLKCGVVIVDLRAGEAVAYVEFTSAVEEIFDVQVVPNSRCVSIVGPHPQHDMTEPVWVVPNSLR